MNNLQASSERGPVDHLYLNTAKSGSSYNISEQFSASMLSFSGLPGLTGCPLASLGMLVARLRVTSPIRPSSPTTSHVVCPATCPLSSCPASPAQPRMPGVDYLLQPAGGQLIRQHQPPTTPTPLTGKGTETRITTQIYQPEKIKYLVAFYWCECRLGCWTVALSPPS